MKIQKKSAAKGSGDPRKVVNYVVPAIKKFEAGFGWLIECCTSQKAGIYAVDLPAGKVSYQLMAVEHKSRPETAISYNHLEEALTALNRQSFEIQS